MSIKYIKIKNKPTTFNRIFGVSVAHFNKILTRVDPEWQKRVLDKYKRPGRNYALPLEDMILILLLYYRSYITQEFVGYLFGLDKSRVCRIIQKLEPILANIMAISKEKKLSPKELEELIVDATEQPIERPQKGQKPYYSGKKKRHTLKTEIRTNLRGRIVHVSKSRPGSTHDYNLHKQEPSIPPGTRACVDPGYQGFDKLHQAVELPYKATKLKPLDKEEKQYNTALSRIRVKVEHVLRQLKIYKILSDRYRNKRKRYNIKFQVISGIVNLKNGFSAI